MEMATSPYRESHDDDIDFELDDQREHSIEDNSMIDDTAENLDTNPNQDDMMLYDDDDNDLVDFDQDLPMEPNESSYSHNHDVLGEEKELVVEPEVQDQTIEDASFEDANLIADDTKSINGEGDEDGVQEEATNIEINVTEDDATVITTEEDETNPQNERNDHDDYIAAQQEYLADTQATDVKDFAAETVSEDLPQYESEHPQDEDYSSHVEPSVEATESAKGDAHNEQSIEALANRLDKSAEDQSDGAEAELEAVVGKETERSPQRDDTPVNLHPVTVRYNGEDCWLFPPFDSTETKHVFLDDPILASEPFDRLIAALRTTLINDQEMADHDELVFDIPVLGLHICEDSKHASLLNLSRVIDIYMMLSQNEGLTVFEPLYCELSTRVCLADQFAYVEDAAFVRRITYTEYTAEQAGSPEEVPQIDDATIRGEEEEEEVRADISTYYDAADDHDDEGELQKTTILIQEQDQTNNPTEDESAQLPDSKGEQETLDGDAGKEDPRIRPDDVGESADSESKQYLDEAALVDKVEEERSDQQDHSNGGDEEPAQNYQDESTTKQIDEVPVQDEPEADEDLFANDPVEPEVSDPEPEKTIQAPETHRDGDDHQALEGVEDNDDFDFENWSDDEQDGAKTEEASNLLSTPSKSVNGKRKLISEDDDFLEIDVSTPEPKRSRQS